MPSREYSNLTKNVRSLEKQFLNFERRTDGNYSRSEQMNCRAFIAFSHAEIEYYLEETARKALRRAEKFWDSNKRASNVIAALLAYRKGKEIGLPDNPKEQNASSKFESLAKNCLRVHRGIISANNGIRAKCISQMYVPLGLNPDDIEEPLIIQLDIFGRKRGDLVHASSQVSLPHIRDPFADELSDVNLLLRELEVFDNVATRLR